MIRPQPKQPKRLPIWAPLVSLAFALAASHALAEPEYAGEGAKSCIDCHGNPRVMGIVDTAHAKRENPDTPAAQKACESCHGPSRQHMQFPMQVANLHFGKNSSAAPKVQNQACIECHGNAQQKKDWHASAHGFENIVCSTCHAVHDPKRIVPSQATADRGCTAAGCHPTLMRDADPNGFSHAVGKSLGDMGQVSCTGCHNPHGPLNSTRCLDCHLHTPEIVAKQSAKARRFHGVASDRGTECIRCHKALSHPIRPLEETSSTPRGKQHPAAGEEG